MDDQDLPQDPNGPTAPPPPPPPPPPLPPRPGGTERSFRRDTANGVLGGVAAGLARHFAIDVVWVRLGIVLLTVFANGLGLVAYLAAWLIVPTGDDRDAGAPGAPSSGPDRGALSGGRGATFWAGAGLVAIGAIVLLDTLLRPLQDRIGWVSSSELIVPLVLILIGALIWRSSRSDVDLDVDRAVGRIEHWAEEVEERAEAWGEQLETRAEGWEARHEAKEATRRTARPQSRTGPVTFGASLLALGGVWLMSSLGVPGVTLTRALAAALLVIGIGLLAGSILGRGRGRGLIVTGLVLAPVVLLATFVPQHHGGIGAVSVGPDGAIVVGDGERRVERPADVGSLPTTYEFDVGSVLIDLRALDRDELARAGTTVIEISLGAGDLHVMLPDDVAIDVRAKLGIGQIDLIGRSSGGLSVENTAALPATGPEDGRLEIRIEQGIGRITVTR